MLCLGTYLTVIKNNKIATVTQKVLIGRIMQAVDPNFPSSDDPLISNLRHGKKNPSEYTIEEAKNLVQDSSQRSEYVSKFKKILPLIDPNKKYSLKQELIRIILEDDEIQGTTVVDIVNNVDKDHMPENKCSLDSILAGILLYVLTAKKHGTGKKSADESQNKSNNLTAPVQSVLLTNVGAISTESEDVFRAAQDFCLKYEDDLDLLPLCQIAFNIDPTKTRRSMQRTRTGFLHFCYKNRNRERSSRHETQIYSAQNDSCLAVLHALLYRHDGAGFFSR